MYVCMYVCRTEYIYIDIRNSSKSKKKNHTNSHDKNTSTYCCHSPSCSTSPFFSLDITLFVLLLKI